MKKTAKALSFILSAAMSFAVLGATACGKKITMPEVHTLMYDIDVMPSDITPAYEQASKAALDEYKAVAAQHSNILGEVDTEDPDVMQAAGVAAAKLFAYACYNERHLDQFVWFANQTGNTDLGTNGKATAIKQEYYIRVNENEKSCGYRYHYTIKKVSEATGLIDLSSGLFESARIRITDKTDLLYRFEGNTKKIKESKEEDTNLGCKILSCPWEVGKDWGKPDLKLIKGEYIEPEKIAEHIIADASDDNHTMRANINILAENVVKNAIILESTDDNDNVDGYLIVMVINTEVANKDEASLIMLRDANDSKDCIWQPDDKFEDDTGLGIVFRLWPNGLFRSYALTQRFSGSLKGFHGSVETRTQYYYSYSDRDCDMTPYLEMIANAKD